ncbi:MAG: hypothetical protein QOC92_2284 [Acidimicrobiaceae bacterium]
MRCTAQACTTAKGHVVVCEVFRHLPNNTSHLYFHYTCAIMAALPGTAGPLEDHLRTMSIAITEDPVALAEVVPGFVRLGLKLVLILEFRQTTRANIVDVRHANADRVRGFYEAFFTNLSATDVASLVALTNDLADELFLARDADDFELPAAFDLIATAILGAAEQMERRWI